ncbi:MAG TPA: DUF433 domain-containing protein [Pirellulales bacterium]|jgi:hypothetical protein
MAIGLQYPHIEKLEHEPARLQRLPRIRVAQLVADYLAYGWSADEMCRQHPHLLPAEAHAAMGYYFDHQAEIDAELAAELKEFDDAQHELNGSPLRQKMRSKGLL